MRNSTEFGIRILKLLSRQHTCSFRKSRSTLRSQRGMTRGVSNVGSCGHVVILITPVLGVGGGGGWGAMGTAKLSWRNILT